MITRIILKTLFVTLVISLVSCSNSSNSSTSSSAGKTDSKGRTYDTRTGRVVHVEVVKESTPEALSGGTSKKAQKEFLEIFQKKKKWSKMSDSAKKIRYYKDMSYEQLRAELKTADEVKTTLIIEALKQRGETGIALIASLLTDTREASFSDRDPIFWYEAKNQPPEPVEIRVFAASQIAEILTAKPQGLIFYYHDLQTSDLGTVKVLYALRGDYATNKEDLVEIWLKWWDKFKSDFSAN